MRAFSIVATLAAAIAFGIGFNPALAQHDGHRDHDHGDHDHSKHDHGKHDHGDHESGEMGGHSHEAAEVHGGAVTMSKEFHVETVFLPDQVRLYLYDGEQNPMHVKHWKKGVVKATGEVQFRDKTRGTADLKFVYATPDGYACPMHPDERSTKAGVCSQCYMKLKAQEIPKGSLWSCVMHPDENGKGPGKCDDCGMKFTPQDYLVAAVDLQGVKAGDAKVTINLENLPGSNEQKMQFSEKFVPAMKMGGEHEEGEHEEGEHATGKHEHNHGDHDH